MSDHSPPAPTLGDGILTLACADRPGIVAAISSALLEHHANIKEVNQYSDPDHRKLFMRLRFELEGRGDAPAARMAALRETLNRAADALQASYRIHQPGAPMKTLILVSKYGHCLNDLLFRHQSGLLPIDIRGVVSNHLDMEGITRAHDHAFHHFPVGPEGKAQAEARLLALVEETGAELVVLARYMQVLSPEVCRRLSGRIINIHHSFLPSFKGAAPYRQACERGVKLIGATAHYVTADLDEGPIIEQGIVRVDHAMNVAQLTAQGRDVECTVLARAVQWHAEHRVFLDGRKTVVFR